MHWILLLIAALWFIQLVNWALHYRLNFLGIYPRHPFGLIGIITAPLLHSSFNHLFLTAYLCLY